MTNSQAEFRKWFVDSLAPLRENGDAGFIFALTAFPLLERYVRRKSGCPDGHDLNDDFFKNLGLIFVEVAGREREFWNCYRNGLLHQVTFPSAKLDRRRGNWDALPEAGISGYDPRPVYFLPATNQYYLNPITFFDVVTSTILADFTTYESSTTPYYNLPSVLDPVVGVPNFVPTINLNLPRTGSYSP